MDNQKSLTSTQTIPEELTIRYRIKRINGSDLIIQKHIRDNILKALEAGVRFIQIKEFTVMVNSIQSIEPLFEGKNTPPRPIEIKSYSLNQESGNYEYKVTNQADIDLWEKLYGTQESEVK